MWESGERTLGFVLVVMVACPRVFNTDSATVKGTEAWGGSETPYWAVAEPGFHRPRPHRPCEKQCRVVTVACCASLTTSPHPGAHHTTLTPARTPPHTSPLHPENQPLSQCFLGSRFCCCTPRLSPVGRSGTSVLVTAARSRCPRCGAKMLFYPQQCRGCPAPGQWCRGAPPDLVSYLRALGGRGISCWRAQASSQGRVVGFTLLCALHCC